MVATRGEESGHVQPLTFFTFRRKEKAQTKVAEMNERGSDDLVVFVVWDSKDGKVVE